MNGNALFVNGRTLPRNRFARCPRRGLGLRDGDGQVGLIGASGHYLTAEPLQLLEDHVLRGSAQSDVAKVRLTDVKGAEIDNYEIAACANITFSSSGIGNRGQEIELLTPADFRMAQSLFRRLLGRVGNGIRAGRGRLPR